jgi:2-C-methyl-D-erythritol 4-phosphate cytidylyltransferase
MKIPISAIIVAAGSGSRLGSPVPKALVELGGRPLFVHSALVFDRHPSVAGIVVVAAPSHLDDVRKIAGSSGLGKPVTIVAGGEHRWQSAQAGVNAVPADTEWVMIHDAARPFVSAPVIDALITAAANYKAAVTVTPEADTVRRFCGDRVLETLDRSTLVRIGTPQLFHKATLLDSFAAATSMESPPTDEAVLLEKRGIPVGLAWGDPMNFKITSPDDLKIAAYICALRQENK